LENTIWHCGLSSMKVAVCYSGLVRNIFDVIDSNKKYLLDLYECDVFFHFWDVFGKTNVGWLEETKTDDVVDTATQQKIISILKPKRFRFDNLKNKDIQLNNIASKYNKKIVNYNAKNSVSMFYSIQESHSNLIDYIRTTGTQYDVVIRIRSDLVFHKEVNLKKVIDNTIIIPAINGFPINDHFGYGNLHTMNIYSGVFNKLYNGHPNIHPETVLFEHLTEYGVQIHRDDSIKYKMVRTQTDGTLVLRGDD